MKTNPLNSGPAAATLFASRPPARGSARFQIFIELASGVLFPSAAANTAEDAVEAFLGQSPGSPEGEITLFDCEQRRVLGTVKWKMATVENGLRVPHRYNIFHDWQLALHACAIKEQNKIVNG